MIHVTVGTDVYGAVRSVERTPVVTKFAMFQFLPIYAIESYYLGRLGKESRSGVPFLAGQSERAIIGIPCDRINFLSVSVAYVRAVGAALVLASIPFLFMLVLMRLSDPTFHFDRDKQIVTTVVGSILTTGLLIALPSYLFTVIAPVRERRIRRACARVLGIAADPAHAKLEIASEMIVQADEFLHKQETPDLDAVLCRPWDYGLDVLDVLLVRTRAQIQNSGKSTSNELNTDRILQAIDLLNGTDTTVLRDNATLTAL